MRSDARILVIGPPTLGAAVAAALPRSRSVSSEAVLSGLWTLGHQPFDGVVMSLPDGNKAGRAIRSLRAAAPHVRVVVACGAADEPRAREAVQAGADEYIIEPVTPEDLQAAFDIAPPRQSELAPLGLPRVDEILGLSEVLRNLDQGGQATLDRLAALLREAFEAESVAIQIDDLTSVSGHGGGMVLQEHIRRREEVVGVVALGRRREGTFAAGDAARLTDYAGLIEVIISQAREQSRWQALAWHDDLSGLHNRRYFDANLEKLIQRATSQRLRLTVVLFDIDDFKQYNDRYGHDTGDALIREVAVLLTRCSRAEDVVARYGGDEFAVILWDAEQPRVPGSQHPTDPLELASRFGAVIRDHSFKCLGPDAPGPVTLSGGLACFPWDGKAREEIICAADKALLQAKRSGKNRIVLATESESEDEAGGAGSADAAEHDAD